MIVLLHECSPRMLAIEKASHVIPWTPATLCSCFQENYHVYGWYSENEPQQLQGFYIAHQVGDEFTLMNIAVHPASQGQGIGRALMLHLIALARRYRASIWLEVRVSNSSAQQLYASLQFTKVGQRSNYYPLDEGREDAIVMCRAADD
ncbi:ribosomal-protein-alanine N-acetyltransferase [Pseudidiomarina aquimaris]|uniref:[Ribosomal protein bS18]-alanine N-acetyltransferase n=1 Tax=Pseudidiomarina aquimaris TaxID=641841 RepID=A0A432XB63_9GAMM|nr:ribosomal protein S18-alanine N-acetyltransferase [Pseudidiomarina aquimaris]RUO45882.1 ribosomal-protein-alanine N-acetyltransferase [Pseudidiomarina aquimaris]